MSFCLKGVIALACAGAVCSLAQEASSRPDITQLNQELQQTRADLADSKRQIEELRKSLEDLRQQVQGNQAAESTATSTAVRRTGEPSIDKSSIDKSSIDKPSIDKPSIDKSAVAPPNLAEPTVAAADQDVGFLAAKVNEMHQDKVESVSKYPVKLSGLILFNSYWNKGTLDIQDLPSLALPNFPGAPPPSVGATLRQTMLGVDAVGPRLFGAQTSAEAEIDFAGGSPTTSFGVATGLLRLRTARVSLDWDRTSLTIGQDNPFFSPLSPTSYATVLEPAMSWSGNLWVWTPGVVLSHRFALGDISDLVLQGGVLDPITEGAPVFEGRDPTPGEASRAPAIAGRIAYDRSGDLRHPFTIGFAGYRAQQQYQTFPTVASWTVNSDIKAGFGPHLQVSGEWYTGQAVGGLGGGIWTSVAFPEAAAPYTAVQPLRSVGGWGQVKVIPATHFEINGAFGQDENFGRDLRVFPFSFSSGSFPVMQKNRTDLVNFIFKPNSFLLFAVEYRHLFTAPENSAGNTGDQVNFAAGVHF